MGRLGRMKRIGVALVLAAAACSGAACRKLEPRELDPVRALRARVMPDYKPPADGLLTAAQIDMFLAVRRAAGGESDLDAATSAGVEPGELSWVRARIVEALLALDGRQVTDTALESYASGLARLRETRQATREPRAASRLDLEIAAMEKERAALRKTVAESTAALKNAALVAPRRAEIEKLGP